MRRNLVVVRLIRHIYDLLICPKRVTIKSLQQRHNVSRRTILRDFARLREAGLPLICDGGFYHLPKSFLNPTRESKEGQDWESPIGIHPSWPLSWTETVALFALLNGARPSDGSEFQALLWQVQERLTHWVEFAFGSRAGSVFSNAQLLIQKPSLSISELHSLMEKYWSQPAKADRSRSAFKLKPPHKTDSQRCDYRGTTKKA